MMNKLLSISALAIGLAAGAAQAGTVTLDPSAAFLTQTSSDNFITSTYADTTGISGTFTFDDISGEVTSWSLITEAYGAFTTNFTYTGIPDQIAFYDPSSNFFTFCESDACLSDQASGRVLLVDAENGFYAEALFNGECCTAFRDNADVPLPATAALLGLGLVGFGATRRREQA